MPHPHIPHISVGNRAIDSRHKEMFDIISRIQHSVKEKDYAAMKEGFRQLEEAALACFSVEERIAQAVGVDFTMHNMAHQNLLKRFRQIGNEVEAMNGFWFSPEVGTGANQLSDLLVRHLDYDSDPLRIVLDTYLYDFVPEGVNK